MVSHLVSLADRFTIVSMSTATSDQNYGDDTLDLVFRALADPTRRAIVSQLTYGEATVGQIADHFDMSLPGVSKHVGVLEGAGLVQRWRSGRTRRCRLKVDHLRAARSWIESQTTFWNDTLEALAQYVEADEETR
jgi:DNA-binding transcriptional ArsR family regulator